MSRTTEPEPQWLNQEELDCWKALMAVLTYLPAALDAQLQRDGKVTLFAYLVMAALSDAPDHTLPMSRLATMSHGSLSRLSHSVTSLERRGWILRRPDPENGRITIATLTEAGQRKMQATAPGHVELARALVLDPLGPEKLRQLGEAAHVIRAQLALLWPPASEPPELPEEAAARTADRR